MNVKDMLLDWSAVSVWLLKIQNCLQSFDTVGWVSGRACSLQREISLQLSPKVFLKRRVWVWPNSWQTRTKTWVCLLNTVQRYMAAHPDVKVLDPIENVMRLSDRRQQYQFVKECDVVDERRFSHLSHNQSVNDADQHCTGDRNANKCVYDKHMR